MPTAHARRQLSPILFCNLILTMTYFDWLSFCQGLDLPRSAATYLISHTMNQALNASTKRSPIGYSPLWPISSSVPWSAHIRIHGISSSNLLPSFLPPFRTRRTWIPSPPTQNPMTTPSSSSRNSSQKNNNNKNNNRCSFSLPG